MEQLGAGSWVTDQRLVTGFRLIGNSTILLRIAITTQKTFLCTFQLILSINLLIVQILYLFAEGIWLIYPYSLSRTSR